MDVHNIFKTPLFGRLKISYLILQAGWVFLTMANCLPPSQMAVACVFRFRLDVVSELKARNPSSSDPTIGDPPSMNLLRHSNLDQTERGAGPLPADFSHIILLPSFKLNPASSAMPTTPASAEMETAVLLFTRL